MQLLVKELANMVQEAAVSQEQDCEAAEVSREQIVETGGFSGKANVPCQRLLAVRGFLNYMVRTCDWMTPYMKGLHNTMDEWCYERDGGGW